MHYDNWHTQLGPVTAVVDADGAAVWLSFGPPERVKGLLGEQSSSALIELKRQLEGYLVGERREFDYPVAPVGTKFQQAVWAQLQLIPFGQTRTYGQLARQLGDENLSRAVGRAIGSNPVSVLIPCHRVVGADGALTGYAWGIERKRFLLELENPGLFSYERFPGGILASCPI